MKTIIICFLIKTTGKQVNKNGSIKNENIKILVYIHKSKQQNSRKPQIYKKTLSLIQTLQHSIKINFYYNKILQIDKVQFLLWQTNILNFKSNKTISKNTQKVYKILYICYRE
ncbi:hypothetical protein TTHERM_000379090 (macronuclear) [Tetrahymena thermophila SB210]|uniref:Uncharacterized protein n=1 Tax=Tetrahymena thermophila (strain SB210) TaxID=312017 RepID=W7XAW1_TETTS|nr:hypothetical protein TTHERM_000379090 [Tetrahymena thermophila SB210]EWS74487.1 hypothetical protein TTHERM_000379090 [Tetrahymena thermophila SB210]|eukprot:XP_012652972.1 hypothetical protein TTHERM_000379090 [Tetrahymena thermophila SB210]